MPSTTADSVHIEEIRAELQSILHSQSFARSPGLSRLLSYLCDKVLAGESSQIKEYSVALDVFGRQDSFDQDSDSIVRVQANRLRKRLAEYYAAEGRFHKVRITIPIGQYVPAFEEHEQAASVADGCREYTDCFDVTTEVLDVARRWGHWPVLVGLGASYWSGRGHQAADCGRITRRQNLLRRAWVCP